MTYCIPYHDSDVVDQSHLYIVFWTMFSQEIITNFLEWLKGKFFFSREMCGESFFMFNVSNSGSYEDTFFYFSSA